MVIFTSGYLVKQGAKVRSWKRRWCVVKFQTLSYYKLKEDVLPQGTININLCSYLIMPYSELKREYGFKINTGKGKRTYYFCADTEADLNTWIDALRRAGLREDLTELECLSSLKFSLHRTVDAARGAVSGTQTFNPKNPGGVWKNALTQADQLNDLVKGLAKYGSTPPSRMPAQNPLAETLTEAANLSNAVVDLVKSISSRAADSAAPMDRTAYMRMSAAVSDTILRKLDELRNLLEQDDARGLRNQIKQVLFGRPKGSSSLSSSTDGKTSSPQQFGTMRGAPAGLQMTSYGHSSDDTHALDLADPRLDSRPNLGATLSMPSSSYGGSPSILHSKSSSATQLTYRPPLTSSSSSSSFSLPTSSSPSSSSSSSLSFSPSSSTLSLSSPAISGPIQTPRDHFQQIISLSRELNTILKNTEQAPITNPANPFNLPKLGYIKALTLVRHARDFAHMQQEDLTAINSGAGSAILSFAARLYVVTGRMFTPTAPNLTPAWAESVVPDDDIPHAQNLNDAIRIITGTVVQMIKTMTSLCPDACRTNEPSTAPDLSPSRLAPVVEAHEYTHQQPTFNDILVMAPTLPSFINNNTSSSSTTPPPSQPNVSPLLSSTNSNNNNYIPSITHTFSPISPHPPSFSKLSATTMTTTLHHQGSRTPSPTPPVPSFSLSATPVTPPPSYAPPQYSDISFSTIPASSAPAEEGVPSSSSPPSSFSLPAADNIYDSSVYVQQQLQQQQLQQDLEGRPGLGDGVSSLSLTQTSSSSSSVIDKRFEINFTAISLFEVIGQGSSGVVYRGLWRGIPVAVKKLAHVTDQERQAFLREADLMVNLRPHPNVLRPYGVVTVPSLMIVMEFLDQGLSSKLLCKDVAITPQMQHDAIMGVALGMNHLHEEGIIHRDLAARNILVDKYWNVKISDFGMSRTAPDDVQRTENYVGPLKWMAPESIMLQQYSKKSDVWSFGVVVWEILHRHAPYAGLSPVQAALGVTNGKLTLAIDAEVPKKYVDLMHACWRQDPNERPSFEEVLDMLRVSSSSLSS
eukprot:TRINITY_DN10136_c0_g1_i2.p1 TRINITY_DN10136_c0_g1~~TRINITY_DN10136_c0_g1_i2.p1  ORF type:complete len:1030 (-),score=276.47 TRINITY_DN10136_c0_g1_i2:80-3169(-)